MFLVLSWLTVRVTVHDLGSAYALQVQRCRKAAMSDYNSDSSRLGMRSVSAPNLYLSVRRKGLTFLAS
jgi:hypothetical protein